MFEISHCSHCGRKLRTIQSSIGSNKVIKCDNKGSVSDKHTEWNYRDDQLYSSNDETIKFEIKVGGFIFMCHTSSAEVSQVSDIPEWEES